MEGEPPPRKMCRVDGFDAIRRRLDPAALESLAATLLTAIGLPVDIVRTALGVAERIADDVRIIASASIDLDPTQAAEVRRRRIVFTNDYMMPVTITIDAYVGVVRSDAIREWFRRAKTMFASHDEAFFPYTLQDDRERLTNVYLHPNSAGTLWMREDTRVPEPGIPPNSKLLTYAGSGLASPSQ